MLCDFVVGMPRNAPSDEGSPNTQQSEDDGLLLLLLFLLLLILPLPRIHSRNDDTQPYQTVGSEMSERMRWSPVLLSRSVLGKSDACKIFAAYIHFDNPLRKRREPAVRALLGHMISRMHLFAFEYMKMVCCPSRIWACEISRILCC